MAMLPSHRRLAVVEVNCADADLAVERLCLAGDKGDTSTHPPCLVLRMGRERPASWCVVRNVFCHALMNAREQACNMWIPVGSLLHPPAAQACNMLIPVGSLLLLPAAQGCGACATRCSCTQGGRHTSADEHRRYGSFVVMCAAGGANAADQHGERKEAGIQDDVAEVRLGVRAGVALHVAEVRLGFQDQVVQHAWYQNQVPGPGSAACGGSRTRFCAIVAAASLSGGYAQRCIQVSRSR